MKRPIAAAIALAFFMLVLLSQVSNSTASLDYTVYLPSSPSRPAYARQPQSISLSAIRS